MLYTEKPEGFKPVFEAVGAFVRFGDEFVLLHRQDHKPEGGTWGIPSGKMQDGESFVDAACRETKEETGFEIQRDKMMFFKTVFVRFASYDFVYHIFSVDLDEKFEIRICENEHKEAIWIKHGDAFNFPLIEDLDGCIRLFFA